MQPTVAKSSMEAEYMALCFGVCEILGINMTATKLGYAKQKPISVYEDTQCYIDLEEQNGRCPRLSILMLLIILFVNNLLRDLRVLILSISTQLFAIQYTKECSCACIAFRAGLEH